MISAMVEPRPRSSTPAIAAHPLVAVIVMGTNDLAKEILRPARTRSGHLTPYLATAVLAAREAGTVILDGATT